MMVVGKMVVGVAVVMVFGRDKCFHGLFMGLALEVGCPSCFPTGRVGTSWSRNAPVLLY